MGKSKKGGDKGDRLRAAEALAAAEKEKAAKALAAKAQKVPGEKRQQEDSSDDGKPSKKVKQVAAKAKVGYRVNPEALREKQTAKKTLVKQGLLPKKGDFEGMDSEADREDDRDYNPDDGEEIGTEQEAQNQQPDSRQDTAENKLVPYDQTQTPSKATLPR